MTHDIELDEYKKNVILHDILCYPQTEHAFLHVILHFLPFTFCLVAHVFNRRSAVPLNFTSRYSLSSRLHVTPTSDVMTASRIAA